MPYETLAGGFATAAHRHSSSNRREAQGVGMIPPPAAGGASLMTIGVQPHDAHWLSTALAGARISLFGHGPACRRGLRQVVG